MKNPDDDLQNQVVEEVEEEEGETGHLDRRTPEERQKVHSDLAFLRGWIPYDGDPDDF